MLLLRAGAIVLTGLLGWYGVLAPAWTQLLWLCYVSTALLIVALAVKSPALASLSAVAWLGMGIPAWLVDLALERGTTLQSLLLHLLAPVLAVLAVRELGYRPDSWKRAWLLYVTLVVACRLVSPPTLNINVAYHGYPPLDRLLTDWWSTWPVYFTLAAAFLYGGHLLVQRLARRLPAQDQSGSPA